MTATNPFTSGAMNTNPNQFIGRRAELRQILARLNGSQPQGSAVVGEWRIGKSSLLYYLTRPRADETLLPKAGLSVVYLSAAGGDCSTQAYFRATLLRRLLAEQPFNRRTTEGKQLSDWQQALATAVDCSWIEAREVLEKLPAHPVVCLDEFQALAEREDFDDSFFNALRNWANEGLLSWVTASTKPLQELRDWNGLTSDFLTY